RGIRRRSGALAARAPEVKKRIRRNVYRSRRVSPLCCWGGGRTEPHSDPKRRLMTARGNARPHTRPGSTTNPITRASLVGARLEQMLEIDPQEAIACLEGQARAAARDIITSDEALTIYQALTPEGWEPGTRLEVKMTIVSIMDRLLAPLSQPISNWSPTAG